MKKLLRLLNSSGSIKIRAVCLICVILSPKGWTSINRFQLYTNFIEKSDWISKRWWWKMNRWQYSILWSHLLTFGFVGTDWIQKCTHDKLQLAPTFLTSDNRLRLQRKPREHRPEFALAGRSLDNTISFSIRIQWCQKRFLDTFSPSIKFRQHFYVFDHFWKCLPITPGKILGESIRILFNVVF